MAEHNGRRNSHSGHIKSDDVFTTPLRIVQGSPSEYRIYNTGDATFIVKRGSNPTDLPKKSSLDIKGGNLLISQSGGAHRVDGIYERLDSRESIRGGRYRGKPSDGGKIVENREGALYRILNSGKETFSVNGTSLTRGNSIDLIAQPDISLTHPSDKEIRVIYDHLPNSNTRSGRFNVEMDDDEEHTIIDLTGIPATTTKYYRILNAGDDAFRVRPSDADPATGGNLLNSQQSIDIGVPGDTIIVVHPVADDIRIKGIYELVGSD